MYTRCIHAYCAMCQIKTIKLEKRRFHKILLSSCKLFIFFCFCSFLSWSMSNTDLFNLSCHFNGIISKLSVLFPARTTFFTQLLSSSVAAPGEKQADTSVSADRITNSKSRRMIQQSRRISGVHTHTRTHAHLMVNLLVISHQVRVQGLDVWLGYTVRGNTRIEERCGGWRLQPLPS